MPQAFRLPKPASALRRFDGIWPLGDNAGMSPRTIDLSPLRKALALLQEALQFWQAQAEGSALKPHLRSAVIQSLEKSLAP